MKATLIFVFLLLSNICLLAQSQWYVRPAIGFVSVARGEGRLNTNLTLGHTVGESNRYRIDVWGSYSHKSVFSTAALFSLVDTPILSTRFVCDASAGAGISKIHSKESVDFIVPIKCFFGYPFTDKLTLGIEVSSFFNLSEAKSDGIGAIGGIPFVGLFLGIKL